MHTYIIALLSSLLKDIKAERPKVTEKDNLRLLFVTKWFLEFFLCERARLRAVRVRPPIMLKGKFSPVVQS